MVEDRSKSSRIAWPALLARLAATPDVLRDMVAGAADVDFRARPGPDAWSASQIIGHLCAIELPYRARLARIMLEHNPHVAAIGWIGGDYDPETPVSFLLDAFAALRDETVRYLDSLPPVARLRTAVHAEVGPTTLRGQVEGLLAHDDGCVVRIAALLEGRDGAGLP